MQSCNPFLMSRKPSPNDCEPLAHAAEAVRLIPFRWNSVARFIVTVEFIDWKMAPEPQAAVEPNWRNLSMATIVASATESLP